MSATKLKLAQQNLARLQASLAWTANRDEVRRRIAATKALIATLKEEKPS